MLRPATTALAALCLLTACGGGSSTGGPVGSGGEGGPPGGGMEGKRAAPLFGPTAAASLRALTGSMLPPETAAENDRRRRAQDRAGWQGRRATLLQGAGSGVTRANCPTLRLMPGGRAFRTAACTEREGRARWPPRPATGQVARLSGSHRREIPNISN